jgi:Domain of unknown function (DUF4124)
VIQNTLTLSKRILSRRCLLFLLCLWSTVTYAEIHKCTNSKGKVNYSDSPCASSDKQATLKFGSLNVSDSNNKIKIDGVSIAGTEKFRERIVDAMAMIKNSAPNDINKDGKLTTEDGWLHNW